MPIFLSPEEHHEVPSHPLGQVIIVVLMSQSADRSHAQVIPATVPPEERPDYSKVVAE
jgi:hypothetical protein